MLDADLMEPVILQVGGLSVAALRAFLGTQYKRGGVALSLYSYALRFEMVRVQDGQKDFYQLKPSVLTQTAKEQLPAMAELRQRLVAEMDRMVEDAHEDAAEALQEVSQEAPAPTFTPAPTSGAFDDLGLPLVEDFCPF